MDNETPKYANWMPEAGGYVANGKVVSKSPQYDESGKLKLDVDASLFTPQPTQSNAKGSGTDANAMATNIGSGASLNINTSNPVESAISSPALKSTIASEPILSIEDQINKEYQDAVARGDYQGMINALVSMGNTNGMDYSAEVERLTKMREEKIKNIDDQYLGSYNQARNLYNQALQNYNTAKASGDPEAIAEASTALDQAQQQMAQIVNEQTNWRSQVGYQDAMQVAQQRDLEENKIRWTNKYLDGVDEIAGAMIQMVGNYINFQYDPYSDPKLARAQAYTKATMTEHFSNIGMYNSSSVAYAITQAIGELVPVYEQMAKDEIKDNINMLQSTASFLINLEESQFNMWKAQVQLQLDQNADKRAEVDQAIQNANARGYYTNEEAALVGVAPGSLSQKAREHEQELLEEIDKEKRKLQQDIVMADYNQKLQLDRMEEENRINKDYAQFNLGLQKDYWMFQVNHPKPTSTGSTRQSSGGTRANYAPVQGIEDSGITQEEYEVIGDDGTVYKMYNTDFSGLMDEDGETLDKEKVENFIKNDLKNITDPNRRQSIIVDLRGQYLEPILKEYADKYGKNYNKTKNALSKSLDAVEEYVGWVEDSGVSRITSVENAREAINYLTGQISDAKEFDHIAGDLTMVDKTNNKLKIPDIHDSKERGYDEVRKRLKNSGIQSLRLIYSDYVYPGASVAFETKHGAGASTAF